MTEIQFDKYERMGAYHWSDYYGGLLRMNAYTKARYDLVADCVSECLQRLPAGGTPRVVDLGCGDGALAAVLARTRAMSIVGLDTSAVGVALAQQQFERHGLIGEFKVITGYDTGLGHEEIDVVVCSEVIEHVDDPLALLREIARVLRPGGCAVITTPIRISEQPRDPMHVREWYVGEFVTLCAAIFGQPVRVISSHPMAWYEVMTAKHVWTNRIGRLAANLLTKFGRNPCEERNGRWRSYTTQTLVLQAAPSPDR